MDGLAPGWGFSAGTFGELVQGQLDGIPFLITLPIPWGTRAVFAGAPDRALEVWPPSRKKALRGVELALESWNLPRKGTLVIYSSLPVGKGMASSSADIVAAIRAVAAYHMKRITPQQIARWAAAVDPTDGIMYPNVVAFNPLTGQLLERLGSAPSAMILGMLGRGRINTEDHHRHREPYSESHQQRLKEALGYVRQGMEAHDATLLGMAGRISAEVQYERDSDEGLARFLELANAERLGVIIGHSGTVRGLLLPAPVPGSVLRRLEQRLWALNSGPVHRILIGTTPHGPWSGRGAGVPGGIPAPATR